jgi:hypothetical protein
VKKFATESRTRPTTKDEASREELKVVILYDEPAAGRHALAEVRNASGGLKEAAFLELRLWRFGLLLDDVLAELALPEIIAADVLLVSIEDQTSLTTPVTRCLQSVLLQKRGQTAAVAILAQPSRHFGIGDNPAVGSLRATAKVAGLDLLSADAELTEEDIFASPIHWDKATSSEYECIS